MFKKIGSVVAEKVREAKGKVALFLAVGMMALAQSSFAALVSLDDSGVASFDPGDVVNKLKDPVVGAINSGSSLWLIIFAALLVIGLIVRFVRGRK